MKKKKIKTTLKNSVVLMSCRFNLIILGERVFKKKTNQFNKFLKKCFIIVRGKRGGGILCGNKEQTPIPFINRLN